VDTATRHYRDVGLLTDEHYGLSDAILDAD